MNPNTGHLVDLTKGTEDVEKKLDEIKARFQRAGYKPVPKTHEVAAKIKLAGEKEAMVSLNSGGKLSKLCANWRKKNKRNIKKNQEKITERNN